MERGQFTFYRSFWEAAQFLEEPDRLALLCAICSYALDEELPVLTGGVAAAFAAIRANLDAGRRKAVSGKAGGSKPRGSVKQEEDAEADCEEDASKNKDKNKDKFKNKSKDKHKCELGAAVEREFEQFWQAYPKKVGRLEAERAFAEASERPPLEQLLAAVQTQRRSKQWKAEEGRFIPNPATWLEQGRWADELDAGQDAPSQWGLDAIRRMMEREAL